MKSIQLTVLLLSIVALGCQETVAPPIQARADPYGPQQHYVASEDLRRATAMGEPIVVRDEFGLLHVTVPIRSAVNNVLYIDYRVTFFDEQRQVIQRTGFFAKTLTDNVADQITFNSTSPRAADFQVDFRWAH